MLRPPAAVPGLEQKAPCGGGTRSHWEEVPCVLLAWKAHFLPSQTPQVWPPGGTQPSCSLILSLETCLLPFLGGGTVSSPGASLRMGKALCALNWEPDTTLPGKPTAVSRGRPEPQLTQLNFTSLATFL